MSRRVRNIRMRRDYEFRRKVERNRTIGICVAAVLCVAAVGIGAFYFIAAQKEDKEASSDLTAESLQADEDAIGVEKADATETVGEVKDGSVDVEGDTSGIMPLRGDTKVKGIYVTGPTAGSSEAIDKLIKLLDDTELNTMVIDVKNDEGKITYQMDLNAVKDMGASVGYITDMDALMKKLKEHNIYTIARIICFKDPELAEHRPELALKKADGSTLTDGYGLAWVNPCKEEVWEYLTDVALEAAEEGFDEIQYDYVRFPIGTDADNADYGVEMRNDTKGKMITGFLTYTTERLHEKGVVVTADVFGTIIGNDIDVERVGQDYAVLGSTVDVLSPMVYPSHYGPGVYGYPVPDAKPYGTVLAALKDSVEDLQDVEEQKKAIVRPWLQAFTATWVDGHISYGGKQIKEQIQAVYDAGYEEWILWNASSRYSKDGLKAE